AMGVSDKLGTIETGKLADIMNTRKVRLVMKSGFYTIPRRCSRRLSGRSASLRSGRKARAAADHPNAGSNAPRSVRLPIRLSWVRSADPVPRIQFFLVAEAAWNEGGAPRWVGLQSGHRCNGNTPG